MFVQMALGTCDTERHRYFKAGQAYCVYTINSSARQVNPFTSSLLWYDAPNRAEGASDAYTHSLRIRHPDRRGDLHRVGHLPEPPLQAGHRGAPETGWPALGEGLPRCPHL
jgi:hypothetical protein